MFAGFSVSLTTVYKKHKLCNGETVVIGGSGMLRNKDEQIKLCKSEHLLRKFEEKCENRFLNSSSPGRKSKPTLAE